MSAYKYCPLCRETLALVTRPEEGLDVTRLRCVACEWTHWNNPTPVLGAIVEYKGKILLARNAAWTTRRFALITGFMEAMETPEAGVAREVKEETNLVVSASTLVGVYDFQKNNQVLIIYHVQAQGDIQLSQELLEYKLYDPKDIICWPSGTGYAVAQWQRQRGIEPVFKAWEDRTENE
jgi:NADH pyrophosphatase NudC (nudix superfamily)